MYAVRLQAFARFGALFAALFVVIGCGNLDRDPSSLPSPSSAFVEITNGYPYVVKVISPGGTGLCTGTFISPKAVLTAAHCTLTAPTASRPYTIVASFGVFHAYTVRNFGPGVLGDRNDISLAILNNDVADYALGQIARVGSSVREDDVLRFVGFGCNNIVTRRGAGTKRTGTNVVYQVRTFVEIISPISGTYGVRGVSDVRSVGGHRNRAFTCNGDSGGPGLHEGTDIQVTTTHSGGYDDEYIYNDLVNLTTPENQGFLRQMDDEYDLGIIFA